MILNIEFGIDIQFEFHNHNDNNNQSHRQCPWVTTNITFNMNMKLNIINDLIIH